MLKKYSKNGRRECLHFRMLENTRAGYHFFIIILAFFDEQMLKKWSPTEGAHVGETALLKIILKKWS